MQPGLQRMVLRLEELVQRIDGKLSLLRFPSPLTHSATKETSPTPHPSPLVRWRCLDLV